MIVFGSHEFIPIMNSLGFIIKNLSSYTMEYRRNLNLVPPMFTHYDDKDFDIKYADYLLRNNQCFYDLFLHLVYPGIYLHQNVYVLVHRDDDIFDMLTDSIQKFIQQRYGVTTYLINEPSDIETILSDSKICNVTREPIHIENIDMDMERFGRMNGYGYRN